MAVVRVQARGVKNEWATIAQLEQSEANDYVTSFRSEHFLHAVEENLRRAIMQQLKDGEEMPDVKATHLRTIRVDDAAFRIVPAWTPGTSIEQNEKTCNLSQ